MHHLENTILGNQLAWGQRITVNKLDEGDGEGKENKTGEERKKGKEKAKEGKD